MNEHSSRSHALLCVTVVGLNKTTAARTTGHHQVHFAFYFVLSLVRDISLKSSQKDVDEISALVLTVNSVFPYF